MNLKPVSNRILIRLHFPLEDGIVLPEMSFHAAMEDKRTLVEVVEVAEDGGFENNGVTCCGIGDFLLLRPDANILPVSKEPPLALIDAGVVLAVVLDDKKPFVPTVVPPVAA